MKGFKQFREILLEGTHQDAKAFHSAIANHLNDPQNFKQILLTHHIKDGASHFNIPTRALNLPKDIKERYPLFQGVKLTNLRSKGGQTYAHASLTRKASGWFSGIRNAISKPTSYISVHNMSHMSANLVNDHSMHGFLHKHTKESWNNNFPVFRHEFEHISQHASNKPMERVPADHYGYHNSPVEVEAHGAQFRAHLDKAFEDHPHEFKSINVDRPSRNKHIVDAMGRIATKTNDVVMRGAVHHYKQITPENREIIHSHINDHISENSEQWNSNRKAHIDLVKAKVAAHRISNKGADVFGSNYRVFGEKKFSKTPVNRHTPEGVMYEPDEALHQVKQYHNAMGDSAKQAEFYATNKIKHPFDGLKSDGKVLDHNKRYGDAHRKFTENNPHVVSHYLNTMSRHFPKLSKRMGKLNYDENEKIYHDQT